MKKSLHFMNNDNGFILPSILFIIVIMFIVLTTNIKIYYHDQFITEQHLEQLKIETIVQMGRLMVKKELIKAPNTEKVHYTFPDGNITIEIIPMDHAEYHLHLTVVTNNLSTYTNRNRLFLNKQ